MGRVLLQLVAVVSLLSLIEGLRSWQVLSERLSLLGPQVTAIVSAIGHPVHAILQGFRDIYRPAYELSLGWVPIEASVLAQDAVAAALFFALAHWPSGAAQFRAWRRLTREQKREIVDAAQEAGLQCGMREARILLEALEASDWQVSYPGAMTADESARLATPHIEKARARFGPAFDAFAAKHRSLGGVAPKLHRMPVGVGLRFIWTLAGVAAALAAIDWVFLS